MAMTAVYVDDIIITGDTHEIDSVRNVLSAKFKCKNLGPCRYLLGLEITQANDSIIISQSGYAQRILKRFSMTDCKDHSTLLDAGTFFPRSTTDDERADVTEYRQMSGSTFWSSAHALTSHSLLSMLSSYNADPSQRHMAGMKQVLRYLRHTRRKNHYPCSTPLPSLTEASPTTHAAVAATEGGEEDTNLALLRASRHPSQSPCLSGA